jgi:hypothetical protein
VAIAAETTRTPPFAGPSLQQFSAFPRKPDSSQETVPDKNQALENKKNAAGDAAFSS